MSDQERGKIRNIKYFETQKEWENWLQNNKHIVQEVWLLFYRPHTEKPVLEIKETLKTAKKYNWKHTLIKRIDDDSYARKFSWIQPREEKAETSDTEDQDYNSEQDALVIPLIQDDIFTSKEEIQKDEFLEDKEFLIDEDANDKEDIFIEKIDDSEEEKISGKDENINFDPFVSEEKEEVEKEVEEEIEDISEKTDELDTENQTEEEFLSSADETGNEDIFIDKTDDSDEEIISEEEDKISLTTPVDEVFDDTELEESDMNEGEEEKTEKEAEAEAEEEIFVRKVSKSKHKK